MRIHLKALLFVSWVLLLDACRNVAETTKFHDKLIFENKPNTNAFRDSTGTAVVQDGELGAFEKRLCISSRAMDSLTTTGQKVYTEAFDSLLLL